VALYVLKVSAKTVFARTHIEQLWIWTGRGRNGKGWWTEVLATLLGTYATSPSLDMITSKLPPANSPSPALLALRGVRGAFITEAEQSLKIYTSTVKLVRDHASKLSSRNLFRDIVTFRPCCSLIVSTNVKVSFTTVDEGLKLSLGVVNWPFQFVKDRTEPQHRAVDPQLKSEQAIADMLPSVFWLLAQVDHAFVKDWQGSVIGPEPLQVQEAKAEFLRERGEASVEAFMSDMCSTTMEYKEATTEAKALSTFVGYMADTMSKTQAATAFERNFAGVTTRGRRLCKSVRAGRGEYIVIK
jgi:putative DNA primase/helicase